MDDSSNISTPPITYQFPRLNKGLGVNKCNYEYLVNAAIIFDNIGLLAAAVGFRSQTSEVSAQTMDKLLLTIDYSMCLECTTSEQQINCGICQTLSDN